MRLQFTKQAREEFLRIVSVFAEYAGPRSAYEPWDWSLSHNISGKHQTISFDPLGEFSRDSAIKMLAFLCVRCSKIWNIQKKFLNLQREIKQ